jgi:hypothetical protein
VLMKWNIFGNAKQILSHGEKELLARRERVG